MFSNEGGNPQTPSASTLQNTSLPDFLGRLSLHYAGQASAMQTMPCYAVNEPPPYSTAFYLVFMCTFYNQSYLLIVMIKVINKIYTEEYVHMFREIFME